MTLDISLARKPPVRAELVGVAVTADAVADKPHDLDWDVLTSSGFEGKVGQAQVVSGPNGPVAVLGMGDADKVDTKAFRQAGVALARAGERHKRIAADVLGAAPEGLSAPAAAQAFVEGLELGAYGYSALKSDPTPNKVASVSLVGSGKRVGDAVLKGQAVAAGVNLARDLVNEPGGSLTPVAFARKANQAGAQRFCTSGGRAFCVYAVIGNYGLRSVLVPELNRALGMVAIDPR